MRQPPQKTAPNSDLASESTLFNLPAPTTPKEFTQRARRILDIIADAVPISKPAWSPNHQLDRSGDLIKNLEEAIPQIAQSFALTSEWIDQAKVVVDALYQFRADSISRPPNRDRMSGKEFHSLVTHLKCELPAEITAEIRKLEGKSLLIQPHRRVEADKPAPKVSQAEPAASSPDAAADEQPRTETDQKVVKHVAPIPITWLRDQVPQGTVKGDASKLANWLKRQSVGVFKVAGKNHAEQADLLKVFELRRKHKLRSLIEEYHADDD